MDLKHIFISLGIAFGASAGIFLDNIGVGISLGFILGAVFFHFYKRYR